MLKWFLTAGLLILSPRAAATPPPTDFGYKVAFGDKSGRARLQVTADGNRRLDLDVAIPKDAAQVPGFARLHGSIVTLSGNPALAYLLLHDLKVVGEIPLADSPDAVLKYRTSADKQFIVGKPKQDTINGKSMSRLWILDQKSGDAVIVWLDPDLGNFDHFRGLLRWFQPHLSAAELIILNHKTSGFPHRIVVKKKHGPSFEMTLEKMANAKIDPRIFDSPKGYRPVDVADATKLDPSILLSPNGLERILKNGSAPAR